MYIHLLDNSPVLLLLRPTKRVLWNSSSIGTFVHHPVRTCIPVATQGSVPRATICSFGKFSQASRHGLFELFTHEPCFPNEIDLNQRVVCAALWIHFHRPSCASLTKLSRTGVRLPGTPAKFPSRNRIPEEISLEFQVSRTPVRESFVRLAQEGLLEVYPQRGTYVSLIQVDLVEEARFMREQLERAVIRLACDHFPTDQMVTLEQNLAWQQECMVEPDDERMFRLDEGFHSTLFAGCNKSNTWSVIQQMNVHLNRSRMLRLSSDHQWDHLVEQHRSMVKAIQQHDADTAERLMEEHLHLTVTDLAVLQDTYPSYFQLRTELFFLLFLMR